jgi:hypothetical protein
VRTQLVPSHWQRSPVVLIPGISALAALIVVAAAVLVHLHG